MIAAFPWTRFYNQNKFFMYHILLILIFTLIFYTLAPYTDDEDDIESYSNFNDCLYYTTITHFTVGLGEISPNSTFLKYLCMLHVILTFTLLNV